MKTIVQPKHLLWVLTVHVQLQAKSEPGDQTTQLPFPVQQVCTLQLSWLSFLAVFHNCHLSSSPWWSQLPKVKLACREIKSYENLTYGPHAACGYHVKLKDIWNYARQMILYNNKKNTSVDNSRWHVQTIKVQFGAYTLLGKPKVIQYCKQHSLGQRGLSLWLVLLLGKCASITTVDLRNLAGKIGFLEVFFFNLIYNGSKI